MRELVGLRDIQSGAAEDRLRKPVNVLRGGVDTSICDMGFKFDRGNT